MGSVYWGMGMKPGEGGGRSAYVEHLNVVEDMVVEGEVVAGNDIDTGVLLDLPVLATESLALGEQVVSRQLTTPVCLVGLLQVSETSHAGETQDRRLNHGCECVKRKGTGKEERGDADGGTMDSSAGTFKYSPDFYYGAQTTSTAELFSHWLTGTLKRPRGAPSRHCSHCLSTPAFKSPWLLVSAAHICLFVPVSASVSSPHLLFAAPELDIVDDWALAGFQ